VCVLSQDIVNDDEIKLDWFFKMSLIHDIVHVSLLLRVMFVFIVYLNCTFNLFSLSTWHTTSALEAHILLFYFNCSIVYLTVLSSTCSIYLLKWWWRWCRCIEKSIFQNNTEAGHCAIYEVRPVVNQQTSTDDVDGTDLSCLANGWTSSSRTSHFHIQPDPTCIQCHCWSLRKYPMVK